MKLLIVSCLIVFASVAKADVPSDALMRASAKRETSDPDHPNGNDFKVGDQYDEDGDLKDPSLWSYGWLQIGPRCMQDYNRWHNTNYMPQDCLGNRELSIKIYRDYIDHYATRRRLGHVPTDEEKARIWNGGPHGWRFASTVEYWEGNQTSKGFKKGVQQYLEDEQSP